MIGIDDVERAAARISGVALRTPLFESIELGELAGGRVFIKAENLQRTGSFKIRGAYNLMSQLSPARASRGVVAWSSGNHAQGVACAGKLLGIDTTIVMPEDAPRAKLENTRALGGKVVTYDRYTRDREAIARDIAAEGGAEIVPSFDHEHIIAGQGTVGLEIAEQCDELGVRPEQVLICCGGGGLTAGSAIALKARWQDSSIYTVEPEAFDDTARSFESGQRESVAGDARSICDALQTSTPGQLTFEINRRLVAGGLTVSDDDVRAAMRFAFRQFKFVVEPGGAVALAALLTKRVDTEGRTTIVVISGGNVDEELFAAVQAESN